jgi:phosphoribosylaminoimidazole-succinocarboxamide synthase
MDNSRAVYTTDFKFPGQSNLYHGKVRDVYTVNDKIVMVATDRVSAFDVVLPKPIPYKGQVLNQLAEHFLAKTEDVVSNWLQAVPDPNVSVGLKADPVKVEMVVRGCLVGHAWREYSSDKREMCGQPLPEGMKEYDAFPSPIITPTTKADVGHDEDITEDIIIKEGLATAEEWKQLCDYSLKLFARGQEMARARGLVLADTKYEFGRVGDKIILIDEVHTPDSSRYFYAEGYDAYVGGKTKETPKHLSKEFLREWLMEHDFSGGKDQKVPDMDEAVINQVSERYIELYEVMSGQKFVKADNSNIQERIEDNVVKYLASNK